MRRKSSRAQWGAALLGVKPEKNQQRIIAGGYEACWRGWKTVGGQRCWFRSLWEYNYGCYLEWLRQNHSILKWLHEPKTFEFPRMAYKRAPFGYQPDYQVFSDPDRYEWHEVKGVLNPASKKKIKRFEKHFPEEPKITLIDKDWFKANGPTLRNLVPGWTTFQQMKAGALR